MVGLSVPTARSCFRSLSWTSGLCVRAKRAHVVAVLVVSWPATMNVGTSEIMFVHVRDLKMETTWDTYGPAHHRLSSADWVEDPLTYSLWGARKEDRASRKYFSRTCRRFRHPQPVRLCCPATAGFRYVPWSLRLLWLQRPCLPAKDNAIWAINWTTGNTYSDIRGNGGQGPFLLILELKSYLFQIGR